MSGIIEYVTMTTACGAECKWATSDDVPSRSQDVRADYRDGYYFDADTLRWFGSRNFATVAPGATVELQTNAPGDRYRVTIWRNDPATLTPEPWFGCYHATRREAVSCAVATSKAVSA